jgi:cytochrome c oxidase subunit 2
MMSPHGPDAGRTAALAWFMFSLAGLITTVVFVLLVVGLFRDGTRPGRALDGQRLIIGGGIILPAIVLLTLSGLTVWALKTDPAGASGDVAITVIGHQYWWEVRYAGTPAVTANEIHVPVGTQVRITLESTDVIHSFWVPALAGKVDMIPGHVNHLTIRADDPGTYRGQCAELCGIQHANMAFLVIAQPMGAYRAWLADQSEPARAPSGRLATTGRRTFTTQACAGCHTIRGTSAHGSAGPDLTHLASRRSLAAATLPNDASHLQGWITDPQHAKPGSLMPDVPITPAQANALVAYLRELK